MLSNPGKIDNRYLPVFEYKLYAPGVGSIVEYEPEGASSLVGCS